MKGVVSLGAALAMAFAVAVSAQVISLNQQEQTKVLYSDSRQISLSIRAFPQTSISSLHRITDFETI